MRVKIKGNKTVLGIATGVFVVVLVAMLAGAINAARTTPAPPAP